MQATQYRAEQSRVGQNRAAQSRVKMILLGFLDVCPFGWEQTEHSTVIKATSHDVALRAECLEIFGAVAAWSGVLRLFPTAGCRDGRSMHYQCGVTGRARCARCAKEPIAIDVRYSR